MSAQPYFDAWTPSPLPRAGSHDALLPEVLARAAACPQERVASAVLELLALQPGDAVLELGCGSGRMLAAVAARLRDGFVAGVDPSPLMVRHAAARNRRVIAQKRAQVSVASTPDLGAFPDARFDRVFGTHVVYFWPDPARDLAEVARVLRPGGLLLLGFFAGEEGERGRTRFAVARARRLLAEAGFRDVEATASAACASAAPLVFVQGRRGPGAPARSAAAGDERGALEPGRQAGRAPGLHARGPGARRA